MMKSRFTRSPAASSSNPPGGDGAGGPRRPEIWRSAGTTVWRMSRCRPSSTGRNGLGSRRTYGETAHPQARRGLLGGSGSSPGQRNPEDSALRRSIARRTQRVECEIEQKAGRVALDQLRTVDRQRLVGFLGPLPEQTLALVLDRLTEFFAPWFGAEQSLAADRRPTAGAIRR